MIVLPVQIKEMEMVISQQSRCSQIILVRVLRPVDFCPNGSLLDAFGSRISQQIPGFTMGGFVM